ncbi:hypothetical protein H0H87_004226 [Tephrocybe sp. NHM501043]|nr:hypothetical protein H0H87_004226 [Tephrocybe sp. NHM501043]
MYGEPPAPDPYSDAYTAPPLAPPPAEREAAPPRGRSRSRSPAARSNGGGAGGDFRSPYRRRSPAPPTRRPPHAPIQAPNPSNVLGVFGLSIRTQERDLDEEFSRFGRVEKVTIVYDQRVRLLFVHKEHFSQIQKQSDRSRGFGFIKMATVEDATRCIQELNGVDLNGRRIRVDYSVTDRPHAPTPGEYMGHRRSGREASYRDRDRDSYRDSYRDRDRDYSRRDRDRGGDRGDRDPYGRDGRDWRDRRSPPPSRGGRYSPDYRRRRSYSRSPPRGSSPTRGGRDYDAPASSGPAPAPAPVDNSLLPLQSSIQIPYWRLLALRTPESGPFHGNEDKGMVLRKMDLLLHLP